MFKCKICDNEARFQGGIGGSWQITCPRCGEFQTADENWHKKIDRDELDTTVVSGWVRDQNRVGITPVIDGDCIERLKTLRRPSLKERLERYLITATEKCAGLTSDFDPFSENLIGTSYCRNQPELEVLVGYLVSEGLLWDRLPRAYWVRPKGHIAADELRTHRAKSAQAFVAMWFADEMDSIYVHGLMVGIKRAGYKPVHIGKKEHANKIDDEIIAEIRRSAFVVADLTGERCNVYFEAGFAIGLSIPVIWTARKGTKDHFDTRQYNCIDWTDADELASRLQQRIEAMFGRGPLTIHHQVRSSPA